MGYIYIIDKVTLAGTNKHHAMEWSSAFNILNQTHINLRENMVKDESGMAVWLLAITTFRLSVWSILELLAL